MKAQIRIVVICVALAVAGGLPLSAQTVIHVPGEFSTIQAGLNAASAGDTVLVGPGTYTGPNNRKLNFYGKALTLKSEQGPDVTIIDAENLDRCFVLNSNEGADTVIEGFTIRNGEAGTNYWDGGGFYINGASPTIRNCVITGCDAARYGGGIFVSSGLPFIDSCTFSLNLSGFKGGGVYGSVVIWNSDFIANEANDTYSSTADGGAAYIYGNSEIRGCRFVANNACRGGALYIAAGSVRNALFHSNTAYTPCSSLNYGGAVFADQAGGWIDFSTFVGNGAIHGGYSVYSNYGTTNIKHSIVWDSSTAGLMSSALGDFSATYSDITHSSGVYPGTMNLSADPLFVTGPGSSPANTVYLSHTAAGQASNSPCINAGQYTALFYRDFGFGDGVRMDTATTRTDQVPDAVMVDLGYHHYFGLIFMDGFEDGTMNAWDTVVP